MPQAHPTWIVVPTPSSERALNINPVQRHKPETRFRVLELSTWNRVLAHLPSYYIARYNLQKSPNPLGPNQHTQKRGKTKRLLRRQTRHAWDVRFRAPLPAGEHQN